MQDELVQPQTHEIRLESLRKLVQSGDYEVPADKLAERLIDVSTTLKQD
jgi:anti-sigma28 factor (negative regulator of flagellin synthesis)